MSTLRADTTELRLGKHVVLCRTEDRRFAKHDAVVLERIARRELAVGGLSGDVLVDHAQLQTVEKCLRREHIVHLLERRRLSHPHGIGHERRASLDDLFRRADLVERLHVHERVTRTQILLAGDFYGFPQIADNVGARRVAPIRRGLHLEILVHIVVEVELVRHRGVRRGVERELAGVGYEFQRDVLQLALHAVEAEVHISAPILHELRSVGGFSESVRHLVLLQLRACEFTTNRDKRNVALRTLEHRATLAHGCTVVRVNVGGHVLASELVADSTPRKAVDTANREESGKLKRTNVDAIDTRLHHLLCEALNQSICDHRILDLIVDNALEVLFHIGVKRCTVCRADRPRIRVEVVPLHDGATRTRKGKGDVFQFRVVGRRFGLRFSDNRQHGDFSDSGRKRQRVGGFLRGVDLRNLRRFAAYTEEEHVVDLEVVAFLHLYLRSRRLHLCRYDGLFHDVANAVVGSAEGRAFKKVVAAEFRGLDGYAAGNVGDIVLKDTRHRLVFAPFYCHTHFGLVFCVFCEGVFLLERLSVFRRCAVPVGDRFQLRLGEFLSVLDFSAQRTGKDKSALFEIVDDSPNFGLHVFKRRFELLVRKAVELHTGVGLLQMFGKLFDDGRELLFSVVHDALRTHRRELLLQLCVVFDECLCPLRHVFGVFVAVRFRRLVLFGRLDRFSVLQSVFPLVVSDGGFLSIGCAAVAFGIDDLLNRDRLHGVFHFFGGGGSLRDILRYPVEYFFVDPLETGLQRVKSYFVHSIYSLCIDTKVIISSHITAI
nr:MAG TPA: hypothetical protein [Caudoviricetes sp.]